MEHLSVLERISNKGIFTSDSRIFFFVHLGSIVEYSTFNLASFIFGGLIYGSYQDFHRTEVLGIRVDKKIYCKLDGKKKPRWYNINGFKLIEET